MPGFVESSYPCHNTGDVDEPEYSEHIHETTEGMEDSQDLSDHDQPFMQARGSSYECVPRPLSFGEFVLLWSPRCITRPSPLR